MDTSPVAQTRPDNMHFLTMNMAILWDVRAMLITRSFTLPQCQHAGTFPNDSVCVTCGYVGVDPMMMPAKECKYLLMEPHGTTVSCVMDVHLFGQ